MVSAEPVGVCGLVSSCEHFLPFAHQLLDNTLELSLGHAYAQDGSCFGCRVHVGG